MSKTIKTKKSDRIILSANGYRLNKEKFTQTELADVRSELTVKPLSFDDTDVDPYAI